MISNFERKKAKNLSIENHVHYCMPSVLCILSNKLITYETIDCKKKKDKKNSILHEKTSFSSMLSSVELSTPTSTYNLPGFGGKHGIVVEEALVITSTVFTFSSTTPPSSCFTSADGMGLVGTSGGITSTTGPHNMQHRNTGCNKNTRWERGEEITTAVQ